MQFEKVAVLGATGPTGRALAGELAGRGVPVRVVSRDFARLDAAFPETGFERRAGDALDPEALHEAIAGCDLVVDCVGLPASQMARHPEVARNVAAAVERSGARCLQISSCWCYMPVVETPVSERHPRTGGPPWARLRREAEDILREAGAAIVHLPDFFGPHVHTGTIQLPIRDALAGRPMNWIGPADIAREYVFVPDAMRAVADLLGKEAAYGDDWVIPGPGPISAREVAGILTEILGRRVKVRSAGPLMLRLVSLFKPDLRGFMQLVPEYVKPVSYDGAKVETLLGPVVRSEYRAAIEATVRSLRSARPGVERG